MSPSAPVRYPDFPPLTKAPSPTSVVKRLYLCRHGQTSANASGVLQGSGIDQPLNEEGTLQAERLRDRLATVPCDIVISSQLQRARQTAQLVHQKHQSVPFLEVAELAEISWGDWEGTVSPHLAKLLESWEEGDFSAKVPNGESPLEVEKRSVQAVYELLDRPESNLIIVIHGRLLRIIMSSLFYRSLSRMSEFVHHNTCINVVDVIVEKDHGKLDKRPSLNTSLDTLSTFARTPSGNRVLDDNVKIQPETSAKIEGAFNRPRKSDGPETWVAHPKQFTFVPVVLDSIDHLPEVER
ncbi:histidine phosphatase superfamily [Powellomyces hirtus]|nr:histidine phosphatase superfamily [Powellomyces hirtus]